MRRNALLLLVLLAVAVAMASGASPEKKERVVPATKHAPAPNKAHANKGTTADILREEKRLGKAVKKARVSYGSFGRVTRDNVLQKLKAMSSTKCNKHLGGFLVPDKQLKQPRLNTSIVLEAVAAFSKLPGITVQTVGHSGGSPVHLLRVHTTTTKHKVPNVLITAGIHGNEPVGVTSIMDLISRIYSSDWRAKFDFWFVPMLNPGGLKDNFRTLRNGKDLNRMFFKDSFPPQIRKLGRILSKNKFAMALDLHGAKHRTGFFLIRGFRDKGLSSLALKKVDKKLLLPSDSGVYPGWVGLGVHPHKYFLKSPGQAKSTNKGTMKGFMVSLGTKDAYTVEYPGLLPVCTRQAGMVSVVIDTIKTFAQQRTWTNKKVVAKKVKAAKKK